MVQRCTQLQCSTVVLRKLKKHYNTHIQGSATKNDTIIYYNINLQQKLQQGTTQTCNMGRNRYSYHYSYGPFYSKSRDNGNRDKWMSYQANQQRAKHKKKTDKLTRTYACNQVSNQSSNQIMKQASKMQFQKSVVSDIWPHLAITKNLVKLLLLSCMCVSNICKPYNCAASSLATAAVPCNYCSAII